MRLYLIPVMGLCFAVDGLLLVCAAQLAEQESPLTNMALAAALGALYGGACLMPPFGFLGGTGWRLVSLGVMGMVAYGLSREGLRCVVVFVLLNMAAGGLVSALSGEETLLAAVIVCLLLLLVLRRGSNRCVPVVLQWGQRRLELLALRDTGNTLTDPVTGERVLVVGPQIAQELLGLTRQQLADPVKTMEKHPLPGLRLIPYRAVGGQGFLLAMRLQNVQIGKRKGNRVVAFAPAGLDKAEGFQALTGGFA